MRNRATKACSTLRLEGLVAYGSELCSVSEGFLGPGFQGFTLGTAPPSNCWIISIIWLYIALKYIYIYI